MALGLINVESPGSLTEPTKLSPVAASALSSVFSGWGFYDVISYPSLKAIAVCNGVDFQYHYKDAAQYLTGPLAPYTAPTLASTAVRATVVLTFTGASNAAAAPANNDIIQIGKPGVTPGNGAISFKTTLDTSLTTDQVLIGANADATISNLTKFINGTGTNGTEYWSGRRALGVIDTADLTNGWGPINDVSVSTSQAYGVPSATTATITFRAKTYGSGGNSYLSVEVVDSGAVMSFASVLFTGGTAGTGTAPSAGTRTYGYAHYRDGDFAQTAISETAVLTTSTNCNATADVLDVAKTRDGMSRWRLFRTTDDSAEFYRTEDATSDPVTDDNNDTTIAVAGNVTYDETVVRPYGSGYPVRYRYHTLHKGVVCGIGARPEAKLSPTGAVAALGDRTVTLSGSARRVTTRCINRTFKFDADVDSYIINDVDEAAGTIQLNEPYAGTVAGAGNSAATIIDERNPFELFRNEPLLLNNWPPAYSDEGVQSDDPTGGTGLHSTAAGTLAVFTMTGVWELVGEPQTGFFISPRGDGAGAYCNQAVVAIDGRLFWLGPDGVSTWAGSGSVDDMSSPDTGPDGQVRGIAGTLDRITPEAVAGIVANYNPTLDVIRWFVPVDGSPFNNFVIVLDLKTRAFTFDECDGISAVRTVTGPDGSYVTVAGDIYGRLWQLDNGYSDGAWGFDPVQAVSSYSAAASTVTVSGTPLPTTSGGLVGVPVFAIAAATGAVQRRTVVSNTSSVATLDGPFDTALTAADQLIFGGIYFHGKTARFSMEAPDLPKTVSSATVQFITSTAGQLWFGASVDDASPSVHTNLDGTVDFADLTSTTGSKWFDLRKGPGKSCQIEFMALAPGFDVTVIGYLLAIHVRDEVPA